MTSEIVILSKGAVALAADSARTIDFDYGESIYPSVDKLFRLSDVHPVGLLWYGQPSLMGVLGETAAALYRKKRSSATFAKLEDCAKDFLDFLAHELFTSDEQDRYFKERVRSEFEFILKRVQKTAKKKGLEKPTPELLKSDIDRVFDRLHSMPIVPEFAVQPADILSRYDDAIAAARDAVFQGIDLSPEMTEKLRAIVPLFINRKRTFEESCLVIAGFGEEEKYPSYFAYEIDCVVLHTLKYWLLESRSTEKSESCITAFAHKTEITALLEGIHPDVHNFIQVELEKALESYRRRLEKKAPGEIAKPVDSDSSIDEIRDGVLKEFREALTSYQREFHSDPIIFSIANLPKKELATLAELLVRWTAFKERLMGNPPRAGGPIDVAVLSKEDGFVWVKKKSYFIPE